MWCWQTEYYRLEWCVVFLFHNPQCWLKVFWRILMPQIRITLTWTFFKGVHHQIRYSISIVYWFFFSQIFSPFFLECDTKFGLRSSKFIRKLLANIVSDEIRKKNAPLYYTLCNAINQLTCIPFIVTLFTLFNESHNI